MSRKVSLLFAVDGTLFPGIRRMVRMESGLSKWRNEAVRQLPELDRILGHKAFAERHDEPVQAVVELIATYVRTIEPNTQLNAFFEAFVGAGGAIELVAPPVFESVPRLRSVLGDLVDSLPFQTVLRFGLGTNDVRDDQIVVAARSDECRALIRSGVQTIVYVDVRRLRRELALRHVCDEGSERP